MTIAMSIGRLAALVSAGCATVALLTVYGLEGAAHRDLIPSGASSLLRIAVVISWIGYLAATFTYGIARHIDIRAADILEALNGLAVVRADEPEPNSSAITEAHLAALRVLKEQGGGRRPHLIR